MCQPAPNATIKRMTSLASNYDKCQKSVYKRCPSPNVAALSHLPSPGSRKEDQRLPSEGRPGRAESGEAQSLRDLFLQRRAEVELFITFQPSERDCSFMAGIVIELKKEKMNTKNPGDYLLMQLLSGRCSMSSLRTVLLTPVSGALGRGSLVGRRGLQASGKEHRSAPASLRAL